MYDRRLDSIVAAAESGSFSKAAKRLGVSTPALAKRIETFENEYDVVLFNRTRKGVFLTPAGASVVEDARALMRQTEGMLRRAKEQEAFGGTTVRLGVSVLCPARITLDLWPRIHELDSSLHLELVPIDDIYDEESEVVQHIGGSIDLVELAQSDDRWHDICALVEFASFCDARGALLHAFTPSDATKRFVELCTNLLREGEA